MPVRFQINTPGEVTLDEDPLHYLTGTEYSVFLFPKLELRSLKEDLCPVTADSRRSTPPFLVSSKCLLLGPCRSLSYVLERWRAPLRSVCRYSTTERGTLPVRPLRPVLVSDEPDILGSWRGCDGHAPLYPSRCVASSVYSLRTNTATIRVGFRVVSVTDDTWGLRKTDCHHRVCPYALR